MHSYELTVQKVLRKKDACFSETALRHSCLHAEGTQASSRLSDPRAEDISLEALKVQLQKASRNTGCGKKQDLP